VAGENLNFMQNSNPQDSNSAPPCEFRGDVKDPSLNHFDIFSLTGVVLTSKFFVKSRGQKSSFRRQAVF
jgi:hypothetical protein